MLFFWFISIEVEKFIKPKSKIKNLLRRRKGEVGEKG
jgi:hypothetical protein